jgi:hypothetical protein
MSQQYPPADDPSDRRRHPRHPAPPMFIAGECRNVVDVSLGGICVDMETRMETGTQCTLVVSDGGRYFWQELPAVVTWCRGGRIGFQWVNLSEEQEAWLVERLQDWDMDGLWAELAAA